MTEIEYTDAQIDYMRAILIDEGANGAFASPDPVSYWEAEQVIEEFEKRGLGLPY